MTFALDRMDQRDRFTVGWNCGGEPCQGGTQRGFISNKQEGGERKAMSRMSAENKSFYCFFNENMDALGVPAPESLFGTLATAVGTITGFAAALKDYGARATMRQLANFAPIAGIAGAACPAADVICETGTVFGGCFLSFYVGACIGSLAAATDKSCSNGLSIFDLFDCARKHDIPIPPALQKTLFHYPEICDADLRSRDKIAMRKAQWEERLAVA